MKRILINATHNEEIRVALCKDNHLYDFDLENRTREQKKANIYKGHITRVEPSLEAAFVEYGSARQGFLPLREIASEYLHGNVREDNIKQLIKEGDEVIVQVEKEERGNKGAALSTYISLAGRYLVLMPNNAKAGGISRQISGKVREEMKQIIAGLSLPKGMSVIVRTAGLGKGAEDLQNDLDHLLDIWRSIQEQNKKRPSPCLVHQEAGVVTRAVRDYLRDDIGEVWIDSENAYNEAAHFISAVMPAQMSKLRKYTEYEPMFARFGIERQIETAYQREVRLPSGGSIVIDQTEAMVAIDINSSKSTKGSDVAQTAYHTNLEAADEIARQLRLRDMGGLIVIDFIDMNDPRHQKDVEKRLIDATKYDRARVQFAEISKFGLMEMSRQRLRPSLEEATGYICPRCHGNGLIRDLRSLSLSIMRQIEQIALKERMGEIQAEVPTDIAAFLLNEKRESLVYLEQDSGVRITILPHAHLESPNFSLHFNPDGFAPSSYERIADTEEKETVDRGYEVNWQNDHEHRDNNHGNHWQEKTHSSDKDKSNKDKAHNNTAKAEPQAVAWLSNLFAPKPQAKLAATFGTQDAAAAIESIVNGGGVSLGASGNIEAVNAALHKPQNARNEDSRPQKNKKQHKNSAHEENVSEKTETKKTKKEQNNKDKEYPKREAGSRRESRGEIVRNEALTPPAPKVERTEKAEKAEKKERHEKPKSDDKEKVARQKSLSDDVVLHISQAQSGEAPTQTIHLSLDNSKPQKASKAKADESKETTQAAESVPSVETEKAETAAEQVQAVEPQASAVVDTKTEAENTAQEKRSQVAHNAQVAQAVLIEIGKQLNKAPNDPRVVQAALAHKPAISGTAGSFIEAVLQDKRSNNFVADFIAAVDSYRAQAVDFDFSNFGYAPLDETFVQEFSNKTKATSEISAPQGKTVAPPLSIKKRAANDPRGQHPEFTETAETVETTEAETHSKLADTETDAKPFMIESVKEESTIKQAETVSTELSLDNSQTNNQASDSEIAEAQATPVVDGDTPKKDAKTKQVEQQATQASNTADADADTNNQASAQVATAETGSEQNKANDKTDADAQTEEAPQESDNQTTAESGSKVKQIRANQKAEKKSKANSYKDMIENVAGQLQPQQLGILNLMTTKTPKTPKTRTRKASKKDNKPKVVVRKISKTTDANSSDALSPVAESDSQA